MPFTPAHAAAALPFLRLRLVPSALVVGTMAPDFEYFLRFAPGGGYGHTIPGAFLLSLPLALIVLWIFHAVVKEPLIELLPDAIRLRLAARSQPFRFGGPAQFVLIILSALTGIATHIAWDAFTHSRTWPARHFPWMTQRTHLPILGSTEHCSILQHVSSVTGILILTLWIARWFLRTQPLRCEQSPAVSATKRVRVLGCIALMAALGGILRGLFLMGIPGLRHRWETVIADTVVTTIALAWWVLVLYALSAARRWPGQAIK